MKDLPNVGDDGLFIEPEVGTWSEDKYRLVSLYASVFTKSMRGKFASLVYIDMFAGPGRVQIKNTTRIYESSPMNALAVEPQFDRLIFCEQSDNRMAALKARCAKQYAGRDVRFVPGDVNANTAEILRQLPKHYACRAPRPSRKGSARESRAANHETVRPESSARVVRRNDAVRNSTRYSCRSATAGFSRAAPIT